MMNRTWIVAVSAGLAAAMSFGLNAPADEPPASPAPPASTAPPAASPAAAAGGDQSRPGVIAPGTEKFYQVLREREGTWDVTASFWLVPGAEAAVTQCTCTTRMILGGVILEERLEGGSIKSPMGEMPWTGLSHTCYDSAQKKYIVNRMSSTCPTFMPESGTYDEEKKVFETTGEFTLMYMKVKVRTVATQPSADERLVEQYMSFNESPEWKGIELKMKRRK